MGGATSSHASCHSHYSASTPSSAAWPRSRCLHPFPCPFEGLAHLPRPRSRTSPSCWCFQENSLHFRGHSHRYPSDADLQTDPFPKHPHCLVNLSLANLPKEQFRVNSPSFYSFPKMMCSTGWHSHLVFEWWTCLLELRAPEISTSSNHCDAKPQIVVWKHS